MDRTQKRCLIGSVFLHGTLLAVLVAGAAFAPKPEVPSVPFLELLPTDLKLTDGDKIGGGNPNAKPPAPQASQPRLDPIAVPPPEKIPPVKAPTTEPKPPKAPRPEPEKPEKPTPPKPEKPHQKAPEVSKDKQPDKAQDLDETRPAKPLPKKPAVQLADRKSKRPTDAEEEAQKERAAAAAEKREANERRERDERDEADRRNQAIEAANASRRDLANRLRSGATSISQGVGTSTTIEMPGPGGQAYGPYISYLGLFYRERWKSPRSSSRSKAYVGASVEIAKDGTVLDWKITDSSGIREVDDSVREVLKRYSKLRALPETTTDPKRLFTIQFRLDADSTL